MCDAGYVSIIHTLRFDYLSAPYAVLSLAYVYRRGAHEDMRSVYGCVQRELGACAEAVIVKIFIINCHGPYNTISVYSNLLQI